MRMMTQRLRCERGFSILTVLIAIVLVSVAAVALSGTTVYVLSLQTESTVRSTATGIASAYMESVKTRRISTLNSEAEAGINELGELDASGDYVRLLTVEAGPVARSKLVTITVKYPRGRANMGRVELVTIVYEGVEAG
jgi:type II secretory pathway pseudopilin PulG